MSQASAPKSLSSLDGTFGFQAPGSNVDLRDILVQLQGLRVSIAVGAAQSTDTSLLGHGGVVGAHARITTSDVILGVLCSVGRLTVSGITGWSLRSDCKCLSTGNIRFTAAATTSQQAFVFWWDTSGYVENV